MRKTFIAALLVSGVVAAGAVAAAAVTGPSSSQSPYVVPSQDGVVTKSILTVGDAVGGYRMVGIPDGLGAYKDKKGNFKLFMNHEIGTNRTTGQPLGIPRAHGAPGAFVSQYSIDKHDLEVHTASDLIQQVSTYNPLTRTFNPPTKGIFLNRLCSADLPERSALYDKRSKLGYDGRLFMNGEESGSEGRAFAHAENGTSYELPALGKFSWENSVANPATGRSTVVVGTDDGTGGQLYVYVGTKQRAGNPAQRAGLTGGSLYGIKVPGYTIEDALTGIPSGTAFVGAPLGDVTAKTGIELETMSDTVGVTEFLRPEDSSWDPKHPNDLYFATTASFLTKSRLWRLRFADPANPAAGGTIDQLLEGTETGGTSERFHMLDNITVDRRGNVLLQEDPGNQTYVARIWQYEIASDTLTEVAHHDPDRFQVGGSKFITSDEESSGIIDAEKILGKGWYLFDVQAHKANPEPELVEYGQLLALFVPFGGDDEDGENDDDDD